MFLDAFWEQHKIPCTYAVKKHHISTSERVCFLVFNGECKDSTCKAKLIGEIDNEPEVGKNIVIIFIAKDTSEVDYPDEKKRPLCNNKRKIIGEKILISGASQWQRKFSDTNIEYGDIQGPLLYNKNVLRKAKQNFIDNDIKL